MVCVVVELDRRGKFDKVNFEIRGLDCELCIFKYFKVENFLVEIWIIF